MFESLSEHASAVIGALVALNTAFAGIIWRNLVGRLERHDVLLESYQRQHDDCQKGLPLTYVRLSEFEGLSAKIDKVADQIANLHLVFRTKAEASAEWRLLEQRLTKIESDINSLNTASQERHRELWDKINRVVDFMREREAALREEIKR